MDYNLTKKPIKNTKIAKFKSSGIKEKVNTTVRTCMEDVAGERVPTLQQLFPYKSSHFFTNSSQKISSFNVRGLRLGHFSIFDILFLFL